MEIRIQRCRGTASRCIRGCTKYGYHMLLVFSQPAYALFDAGTPLSCMSEAYENAYDICLVTSYMCMIVSTPLGVVEPLSRICGIWILWWLSGKCQ